MPHGEGICLSIRMGCVAQLQLTCQTCRHPLQEDFEHGCLVCPACGRTITTSDALEALEGVWFQLAGLLNALRGSEETQRTAQELFAEASRVVQHITPFVGIST